LRYIINKAVTGSEMPLILDWEDYDHLWSEAQEVQVDPHEQITSYPEGLGSGYSRNISLRNGIHLTLHEFTYRKDVKFRIPAGHEDCLELIFNMADPYQRADGVQIPTGHHYLMNHQDHDSILMMEVAHHPRRAVDVHLSPAFWQFLVEEHGGQLHPEWRYLSSGIPGPLFSPPQSTTLAMQQVLRQIWRCPFDGVTRRLFLEGKSLELLALQLEGLIQRDQTLTEVRHEPIHLAREILEERLTNPPSLIELAHLVGLNDFALKKGFREVLGTTVFGYVHQRRMEQAQQMLGSPHISVWQVAIAVGYANTSTFSKAFRKHFGITPKKYQMQS
jgi:AraC family transcriptional activator of pyochelin receptor